MKKIIDYCKNNVGVVIIAALVFIFAVFTIFYIFFGNKISQIEENKIKNDTSNLVYCMEDLVNSDSKKIDKYILYTLDYYDNIYLKDEVTVHEIYEFIKDNFTVKTSEEEIKNIGITPLLVERNVVYDFDKNSYKIGKNNDKTIRYYKLGKIKKINKRKYAAYYQEYIIEDPFDMLNYYLERNSNAKGVKGSDGTYTYDLKDVTPIKNYINGSSKAIELKKIIDDEVDNYSTKGKKIKVTYVIEDDKVLINKIGG